MKDESRQFAGVSVTPCVQIAYRYICFIILSTVSFCLVYEYRLGAYPSIGFIISFYVIVCAGGLCWDVFGGDEAGDWGACLG